LPQTPTPIRVGILTDDLLFADGLRCILSDDKSFVVSCYGTGTQFISALSEFAPEIAVLDTRVASALSLSASLSVSHGLAIIFVCAPDDEAWALEALQSGARGLLAKTARAETLIEAIRIVHEGLMWVPHRLLVKSLDRLTPSAFPPEPLLEQLSPRERDVFRQAATGVGNKELSGRLGISEATVKVHLTRIFQKLGLRGRAELAAAYHGLRSNTTSPEGVTDLRRTG
jgi:DNA-binding NarL/FixJ family response regulator